ncbi:SDR family NAD(P)-dependent oxidoreductase [Epibacterium sp. Ofav1-8]|uniref:SDR family NAD(P)-dependent oxidoreductase n=1 Tax=Epibacterium sp. Ofav1-8 TaxID=2917735 RepID=UPI001EF73B4B|nr:SDR family oxidoreductase [Epibacterium sp. Ofav1-8]MCG7622466.1 SDR family oxidoreductase [Epibacterium sp. Ofav1-8]
MRRTVLVTGGTYGLGRAISAELARDHNILRSYRKTAPGDDLEAQDNVVSCPCDLLQDGSAEDLVARALDQFGRIDVIVNNAGLVQSTPKESFDADAHQNAFALNAIAPQALLTAALPHLRAGAAIVSISSVNAVLPPQGAASYGASKAALNLWTKAMAKELGPQGIRVNAVAPGAINVPEAPRSDELTQLFVKDTALGRPGTPEDIAKAVRFLASDEASFITGEILTVAGGYRL